MKRKKLSPATETRNAKREKKTSEVDERFEPHNQRGGEAKPQIDIPTEGEAQNVFLLECLPPKWLLTHKSTAATSSLCQSEVRGEAL